MRSQSFASDRSVYWQIRSWYRLTQEEWARAFGVSRPTVSTWENEQSAPPPAALAAYRKLQEPIRTGDMNHLELCRQQMLAASERARGEVRRLNRASTKGTLTEHLALGVGAVAIALLLAALFSED